MNQAILVLQNDGDEWQIESADAGLVRLQGMNIYHYTYRVFYP